MKKLRDLWDVNYLDYGYKQITFYKKKPTLLERFQAKVRGFLGLEWLKCICDYAKTRNDWGK